MNNFNSQEEVFKNTINLPATAKVVFVSDLFVEDYVGGAELTSEALIEESPFEVFKIHSKNLNMDLLKDGVSKFWIFGNFAQIDPKLIPSIIANLKYSVLEYDYKYCKVRSPEKHKELSKFDCDCHNQINGKLISAFYYGATCLWWMSEAQLKKYIEHFPFIQEKDNVVLSSVFSKKTLGTIKWLRNHTSSSGLERKSWIVLGSNSWVKGAEDAVAWCKENDKEYEVVWGLNYDELLQKLSISEGFVYLPKGSDTCPRMVIEAKLLNCKLHLNDYVQHKDEEWFSTNNLEEIEEYLYSAPNLFWNAIKSKMEKMHKISGYTTVYNAESQGYPFEQSIKSMLQFCDEVCVIDGGSSDLTWQKVRKIQEELVPEAERIQMFDSEESRLDYFNDKSPLKIKRVIRDWNHPRFAVFDGMQKAEARKMCTGDFCWQMDCDEVVHESDAAKIQQLCNKIPNTIDIVSLPVIEYWGSQEKVRVDIMPWKWRLSRNKPNITHGIPADARRTDENGFTYAAYGDGCDMIDSNSGERINHVTFYNQEIDAVRKAAVFGNKDALEKYQSWFNQVIDNLPGVFHYSWFNIERKIKLYKNYWTRHWESLSGKKYEDTAESNMMFDVPWSEVTDEMIKLRSKELAENLGGWIWHQKWDGKTKTHHIVINRQEPKIMREEV